MSVYRPPMMRGRGRGHHRDSNSPKIGDKPQQKFADVGKSSDRWSHDRFYESAYAEKDVGNNSSENNSPVNREIRENVLVGKPQSTADLSDTKSPPEKSRPTDRPRSRNKRPDIQVYVPRGRRSQDNKTNTSCVDQRNSQSFSNITSMNKMSSVHSPARSTTSEFVSPNKQVTSNNRDVIGQNSSVISTTNIQNHRQLQINKKLKTYDKRKEEDKLPVVGPKADLSSTQNSSESDISVARTCNEKDEANVNCDTVVDFNESRLGIEREHRDGSDKASDSGSYEESKESEDLSLSEHSQSSLTPDTIHDQKLTSDQQNSTDDIHNKICTLDSGIEESSSRIENNLSEGCATKSAIIEEFDKRSSTNKNEHFHTSPSSSNSVFTTENESGAILTNANEKGMNKESKDLENVEDGYENELINSSNCNSETDIAICTGTSKSEVSDKLVDKVTDTENKAPHLLSELQDTDMCVDMPVDDQQTTFEETQSAGNYEQHQNLLSSDAQPENADSLESDTSVSSSNNLTCSDSSVITKKDIVETHVVSSETNLDEMMETKELTNQDVETKTESGPDGVEVKVKQTDVLKDKRKISDVNTSCKDSLKKPEGSIKAVPNDTDNDIEDKESMKDGCMEVEAEEDTWDSMFNEDGDCLDPLAMEELTKTVGKVKIQKSKKINYLDYQPKDKAELNYSEYGHIIEIYDFPAEFVTRDLITAFQPFLSRGFDLKWVDDTHALGIFSSGIAAQDAAGLIHPLIKVRPLSQASQQSRNKARRCSEFLQPYKPRPETSATAARRLVAGALGIATNVSKEKRERERQQLKQAKEKRRKDRQDREDIWEYGKCAMDEES